MPEGDTLFRIATTTSPRPKASPEGAEGHCPTAGAHYPFMQPALFRGPFEAKHPMQF